MSKIQWTNRTSNPFLAKRTSSGRIGWHCRKISPGCSRCYAESWNLGNPSAMGTGLAYVGGSTEDLEPVFQRETLRQILRWRKPERIFPWSMTDAFLSFWPSEWIQEALHVYRDGAEEFGHTIQILTKRPERMLQEIQVHVSRRGRLPERIWIGFSAEDQKRFSERWPVVKQAAELTRGLLWCSHEPALEPIDFREAFQSGLRWLVVGGESGRLEEKPPRPFALSIARDDIRQARDAGAVVFLKQLGARPVGEWGASPAPPMETRGGVTFYQLDHGKGGEESEFPPDLRGARAYPDLGRSA